MEKRTLLAVVLTMIVWVGWFYFFVPDPGTQDKSVPVVQEEKAQEAVGQKAVQREGSVKAESYASVSRNIKEQIIELKTDKFQFELTNKGASIKRVNYIQRDADLTFEEKLFNSKGEFDFTVSFSESEFLHGNELENIVWDFKIEDYYTIKFFTNIKMNDEPLRIEKIFTFTDRGYDFNVEYRFINIGKRDVRFKDGIAIFSPSDILGPKLDYKNNFNSITGIYSVDGSFEKNRKGGGFFSKAGEIKKESGSTDYAGIMSRYFLLIMKPKGFTGTGAIFDNRPDTGSRTGLFVEMNNIAPGAELAKPFRIYLGEKDKDLLKNVDPILVKASDVSTIIEPIRYFVIWALMNINKLFGNLGLSLVIFSVLTKIVFMPLTKKSTDSMKKMQDLSPELKKLQAKYKDKPDVLQRETMKLYKENKVNPLGGCLPLLLQMPFFFALYSALINSLDLWNAPFIFWIKDLSMPDTLLTVSGFNVNVLPLLMIVSTILQQRQTMSEAATQQQKMMMYMMPAILLFIFWTMPSGLVLYWFLQNLYQILHQYVVNHLGEQKKKKINMA